VSALDADGRPSVVVLRALGLGDLLTAVPALRALRRRFDRHRMVLIAPAALAPLARLSGAVDIVVDRAGLDRASLFEPLPADLGRADVAVNLHGRGPESSRLLAATGPGRFVAFAHPDVPATTDGPAWDPDEHEVQRWCRLVQAAGADARPDDLLLPAPNVSAWATTTRPDRGGGPRCGPVVLHPGAASESRRWPVDRWAEVARALVDDGHDVVLTGSSGERLLAEQVLTQAGIPASRCRVAAGSTDVLGLADLVAAARLVVCGDTGVAHLATAFATPSVLLFGPVAPDRWGPITDGPHRVLWAGRHGDPHGSRPDPGLLALTTEDVLTAAQSVLDGAAARR
jgi:ADP-heptose:LPS heptosyltransferase